MGQENLPWKLVEGKKRADDPRFWPGAQLSGESFEDALIVDVDITAAELIGASFKNCTLARLDLRDAFMSEATFENCTFYKCDLRRADLSQAKLKNVTIDRSNLCASKLTGIEATNLKMVRSEAAPANFKDAKIDGIFSYCDLSAISTDGAQIDNLHIYRCNTKFTKLSKNVVDSTNDGIDAAERAGDHQVPWFLVASSRLNQLPPSGNLTDVFFFGEDLSKKDFSNRTLTNVNFVRCNLVETNFSNTTLTNVWFWDCEVDQLTFLAANINRLSMAYVIGTVHAKLTKFHIWNVSDSEMADSNFEGATINAANFSMTSFMNSRMTNLKNFVVESFMTDFIGVDFNKTNLSAFACERSYLDPDVSHVSFAQSQLKTNHEVGDFIDLYMPADLDAPKEEVADLQPKKDAEVAKAKEEAAPAGPFVPVADDEETKTSAPTPTALPEVEKDDAPLLSEKTRPASLTLEALAESHAQEAVAQTAKKEEKVIEPVAEPVVEQPVAEPVAEPVAKQPEPVQPAAKPAPAPAPVEPKKPEPVAPLKPATPAAKPASQPSTLGGSSLSSGKSKVVPRRESLDLSSTSTDRRERTSGSFGGSRSTGKFGSHAPSSAPSPLGGSQRSSGIFSSPPKSTLSSGETPRSGATGGFGLDNKPHVPTFGQQSPSSITSSLSQPTFSSETIPPKVDEKRSVAPVQESAKPSIDLSASKPEPKVSTAEKSTDAPEIDLSISEPAVKSEPVAPKEPVKSEMNVGAPTSKSKPAPAPQETVAPKPAASEKLREHQPQGEPKGTDLIRQEEKPKGFFARIIHWFKSLFS